MKWKKIEYTSNGKTEKFERKNIYIILKKAYMYITIFPHLQVTWHIQCVTCHVTVGMDRGGEWEFYSFIIVFSFYYITASAEKCSYISRLSSRNEREGLLDRRGLMEKRNLRKKLVTVPWQRVQLLKMNLPKFKASSAMLHGAGRGVQLFCHISWVSKKRSLFAIVFSRHFKTSIEVLRKSVLENRLEQN